MTNSWKNHETTWCLSLGSCIWLGQAALRSLCYRGTAPRLEGVEKETPEVSHGTLQEKLNPGRRFSKILEMALFFFVRLSLRKRVLYPRLSELNIFLLGKSFPSLRQSTPWLSWFEHSRGGERTSWLGRAGQFLRKGAMETWRKFSGLWQRVLSTMRRKQLK